MAQCVEYRERERRPRISKLSFRALPHGSRIRDDERPADNSKSPRRAPPSTSAIRDEHQPASAWHDPREPTARQTDIANLEAASQNQDPSQQTVMATLQRINQASVVATANAAGCQPDQRQSCPATDDCTEAATGRNESRVPDAGNFNNILPVSALPLLPNGAAQALTY
jgi:hypothetical protein